MFTSNPALDSAPGRTAFEITTIDPYGDAILSVGDDADRCLASSSTPAASPSVLKTVPNTNSSRDHHRSRHAPRELLLPKDDPPTASADLHTTRLRSAEHQRFTLFGKLPQEIQTAVWHLGLPRRNILVSGRKSRILRMQGTLVPPVGFSVCQNSRTEALRHYARFWKEHNGRGYVYISYSHDTLILYCDTRTVDDEDGGPTWQIPDRLHRDWYIYDVINGLKPGLDKIQSLAVDVAFLRDHPQHQTGIHSNIYTLLRTWFPGLRRLMFIAQFQHPHGKKRAIVIEDLSYGALDKIDALHKKISKNLESPPEILEIINERGYPQEMKELKAWHEENEPISSWKVEWKVVKVRTYMSSNARQCDVYPKGVEHSDLLQLADNISQWSGDNTDVDELHWRWDHNLYPGSLSELAQDKNFQQFISKNAKDPKEVGIGIRVKKLGI